jgi:hypothetical protein
MGKQKHGIAEIMGMNDPNYTFFNSEFSRMTNSPFLAFLNSKSTGYKIHGFQIYGPTFVLTPQL